MVRHLVQQVLSSAVVYTMLAALAAALIGVGLRGASASRRLLAVGAVLGVLSAFLFVQPVLSPGGYPSSFDPAHWVSYFSLDPLGWLALRYGFSGLLLGPAVSLVIGVGFLTVLLRSAGVFGIPRPLAWGVSGAAALPVLAGVWFFGAWAVNGLFGLLVGLAVSLFVGLGLFAALSRSATSVSSIGRPLALGVSGAAALVVFGGVWVAGANVYNQLIGIVMGLAVSLVAGLGIYAALSDSTDSVSRMSSPLALKTGVFGGAALVALGLIWGLMADNLALDLSVPIVVLVTYPTLAYLFSRDVGPEMPETTHRHSGWGIASVVAASLVPLAFISDVLSDKLLFPGFLFLGAPAGVLLAAAGLFQRHRKRLFPVLGLTLNVPLLVLELAVIALAGAYVA